MSVSVDAKGLAEKAFDNFKKITPALLSVAIATGSIIFLPQSVLQKMSLDALPDAWRKAVGIIFIISIALIVTILIVALYRKINRRIRQKRLRKKMRENLINLSPDYKRLLLIMLKSKNRSIELAPTSGDTLYLKNNCFIYQTQDYMFVGPGVESKIPFAPHPWLIDLYNTEPELFE